MAHEDVPPANATASVEPVVPEPPCVVVTALREVGTKEVGCENCGPRVEEYLASVNLGRGWPWCAAALHWSFRQCGTVLKPERAFAAAAQFATAHEVFRKEQLYFIEEGSVGHPMERICEDGDVGVLYYPKLGRIGHCFLVIGETDDYVLTAEGNSNTDGSREGTTFVRRKRLKGSIHSIHHWIDG